MTKRRAILIAVAAVVVAALTVGGATGVLEAGAKLGISVLRDGNRPAPTPSSPGTPKPSQTSAHQTPSPSSKQTESPTPSSSLAPVLAAAKPKRADAKKLKKRIGRVHKPKHVGAIGATVLDGATGKSLYQRNAGKPRAPASTAKLLTSAAALQLLDGQHRFQTKVVTGKSGQIILVGGGDPYLTSKTHKKDPLRGSLQQLAAATAKKLRANKHKKVQLGYDASLFQGRAWNPHWPGGYHDQVSPVSALWADEGRVTGGSPGKREPHPSKSAATEFAELLKKYGVKTSKISHASAQHGKSHGHRRGELVAAVDSLPLNVIVERLLRASDNDAAEVVARQVAIAADKPPSFAGAVSAIKHVLNKTGVWRSGTRIYDGSGLSRDNRVPAVMFAAVLVRAANQKRPRWGPLLAGLPVAGVEGSLSRHYTGARAKKARGVVHAKTGTLRGVHSLAGYAHTSDGELLIFSLLVDDSKQDYMTPIWLHRLTTAIASCGCRT